MTTTHTTRIAFVAVTTLFFAWGFITSLLDPLVAAVKGVFTLTDLQAQLSASAFFLAYGLVSLPAAVMVSRRRPVPSILIALAMMTGGCLVMLAAANLAVYALVLAGLFLLASGITILQVAANPLAAALGEQRLSHFRLTLAQAFNSFGTFIGPYLGAALFLEGLETKNGAAVSAAARAQALVGIDRAFFWIAGLILLLLAFFFAARRRVEAAAPVLPAHGSGGVGTMLRDATSSRWAMIGAGALFLYVGAEVSIGTQMAFFLNSDAIWGASQAPAAFAPLAHFLQLDATPGVSLQEAGRAVSLYWGGAMVGRIIGAALLSRVNAARLLMTVAAVAAAMCLFVAFVGGPVSGFVALAIGLFNAVMFPVIFTLTLERSTASAEATSGLLCTAIVGGAALPPLVGAVSGSVGYAMALVVPAACYIALSLFAAAARRAPVHQIATGTSAH